MLEVIRPAFVVEPILFDSGVELQPGARVLVEMMTDGGVVGIRFRLPGECGSGYHVAAVREEAIQLT